MLHDDFCGIMRLLGDKGFKPIGNWSLLLGSRHTRPKVLASIEPNGVPIQPAFSSRYHVPRMEGLSETCCEA